jgi:hypothetical protein
MTMTATADRFANVLTWALSWARTNGPKAALEIGVNFALPFAVYSAAHAQLGDVGALLASSAPPLAWSIFEFARHRRIDALSLLVLAGIVLSLLPFIGGGGVRFLQLRERLVTAIIGMAFLTSAAIGKPLIYQLSKARIRRGEPGSHMAVFESLRDHPVFRRTMMVATVAWGVTLVGEAAVSAVLVFALSIKAYMVASAVIGYSALGLMTAWTFWYVRRRIVPLAHAAVDGQSPASSTANHP